MDARLSFHIARKAKSSRLGTFEDLEPENLVVEREEKNPVSGSVSKKFFKKDQKNSLNVIAGSFCQSDFDNQLGLPGLVGLETG